MKFVLILIVLLAVAFLFMIAYLYLNQRNMIYFPQRLDRDWEHVQKNEPFEIEFQRDGNRLKGWLIHANRDDLLIYYGGNAEELSYNIADFEQLRSHAVLLVNYRGFGESEGRPTESDLVADALMIVDEIRDRFQTVVIMGRSLGSGVAVQVASQRNLDGVILVTPYDSIAAVGQDLYPWAPVKLLAKDPYDSLAVCSSVRAPTLFLVAERDEIIPLKHSQNLADHWPSKPRWVTIADSDHNSVSGFPLYWREIQNFLNSR